MFPVKISHLSRFFLKMANHDTLHLAWTVTSQTKKFNFTLQSEYGEKLNSEEVKSGNLIVQSEGIYKILVSATTEGGQATICNLQPGISYRVVIDALNENRQCTGRATATIPSTATEVPTTPARETHDVSEIVLIIAVHAAKTIVDCFSSPQHFLFVKSQK